MSQSEPVLYHARPVYWRVHPLQLLFAIVAIGLGGVLPGIFKDSRLWALPAAVVVVVITQWIKSYLTRLTVTATRVTLRKGILTKRIEEVRIVDIRNITIDQRLLQRMLDIGDLGLSTAGQADVELEIANIPRPWQAKEAIDSARG
jgi:uncharacterized membrane protein YdbT with pleckstrin-like domain